MANRNRYQRKSKRVVEAVLSTEWAIREEKLEEILGFLELREEGYQFTEEEIQARIGPGRSQLDVDEDELADAGVAVLPLFGVISHRMNLLTRISGGTSTEQFGNQFKALINDPAVNAIVIDVDSPGGSVAGVEELSAMMFANRGRKPVIAVSNMVNASAAYYISSNADEVVASPSSLTGSIGVFTIHTEISKAEKKAGIKRTIVRAGKFKAEANAFETLSKDAEEAIQRRIDTYYRMFAEAVARARGVSASQVITGFGQGRILNADAAVEAGLVDRIATIEDVLRQLGVDVDARAEAAAAATAAKANEEEIEVKVTPQIRQRLAAMGLAKLDATDDQIMGALSAWASIVKVELPDDEAKVLELLQQHANGQTSTAQPAGSTTTAAQPAPAGSAADPPQPGTSHPAAQPQPPAPASSSNGDGDRYLWAMQACRTAGINDVEFVQELVTARDGNNQLLGYDQLAQKIFDRQAEQQQSVGPTISFGGESEREKFHEAAVDALLERAWSDPRNRPSDWKPRHGADSNFALRSLPRLAEECLRVQGVDVRKLAPLHICQLAMGFPVGNMQLMPMGAAGPGIYNSTGNFPNILFDAQNVVARRSYEEATVTFDIWCRRAENLPDFKEVHKTIAGELPDPKEITENGEIEESTITDGKESYRLAMWGEIFSLSLQSVLGDRFGQLMDTPMKQSRAMRRKQNKLVYGELVANPELQTDGVKVFDGAHNNIGSKPGGPGQDTLDEAFEQMMTQSGLNPTTTLNIPPRWILLPAALSGTTLTFLGSISPTTTSTASNEDADRPKFNANVKNIYGPGGDRPLQPVVEAQLDAASKKRWYLAADWMDVDTAEYAFLEGLETPALDQERAFDKLALRMRIYQAFAVRFLDFRGVWQSNDN